MAKTLPAISTKFKGAVQKSDQEKKITELQTEIEQLRSAADPELTDVIEQLRSQLESSSGEVEIEVKLIDSNPNQPRQTITSASIQAKARSLKKHGQISPVILIPSGNGRYTLLDGQLRWEGAKVLEWKTIRSVVVPVPQDLDQSSLLTFLGFEDLNPLDKAEAIVREITKSTELNNDEIYTTLGTAIKRIERDGKVKELANLVTLSSEEQLLGIQALGVLGTELEVFLILLELGLNPTSVKANLMPMLFLPQDLKDAIRNLELKGAHALALSSGLSSKALGVEEQVCATVRGEATKEVLSKNLTVPETRELIKQIKAKYVANIPSESKEVKIAIAKINTLTQATLSSASNQQLEQLKELLKLKLLEVENLMN